MQPFQTVSVIVSLVTLVQQKQNDCNVLNYVVATDLSLSQPFWN